jgi:hypothetical protein
MKRLLPLLVVLAVCGTLVAKEPPVQKIFEQAVAKRVQGCYCWDRCTEGDALHWLVFSYNQYRPKALGQKLERYAKLTATGSRNPKATLYTGAKTPDIDLFASSHQIYQLDSAGQPQAYSERVTLEEFRSFLKTKPPVITADALLAYVNKRQAEKL